MSEKGGAFLTNFVFGNVDENNHVEAEYLGTTEVSTPLFRPPHTSNMMERRRFRLLRVPEDDFKTEIHG